MTTNNDVLFNEAPASWNTRYVTPDGFECQLTIRGEKGAEVLEKANAAIAYLLKSDCQPYKFSRNGYSSKKASSKPSNGKDEDGTEVAIVARKYSLTEVSAEVTQNAAGSVRSVASAQLASWSNGSKPILQLELGVQPITTASWLLQMCSQCI